MAQGLASFLRVDEPKLNNSKTLDQLQKLTKNKVSNHYLFLCHVQMDSNVIIHSLKSLNATYNQLNLPSDKQTYQHYLSLSSWNQILDTSL